MRAVNASVKMMMTWAPYGILFAIGELSDMFEFAGQEEKFVRKKFG